MKGNERADEEAKRADEEAKRAANKEESRREDIPVEMRGKLPISKVAENQRHHNELWRTAKRNFAHSPRACDTLNIDPTILSPAYYMMS